MSKNKIGNFFALIAILIAGFSIIKWKEYERKVLLEMVSCVTIIWVVVIAGVSAALCDAVLFLDIASARIGVALWVLASLSAMGVLDDAASGLSPKVALLSVFLGDCGWVLDMATLLHSTGHVMVTR